MQTKVTADSQLRNDAETLKHRQGQKRYISLQSQLNKQGILLITTTTTMLALR